MNALSLASIDFQHEPPAAVECVANVRMMQTDPNLFFELQARDRQQDAISALAQLALNGETLERLFHQSTELIATGLEAEFVKFAELLPTENILRLRAGVGWRNGDVGRTTFGADGT